MRCTGLRQAIQTEVSVVVVLFFPVWKPRTTETPTGAKGYSVKPRPQPDIAFATRVLRQAHGMTQQRLADVIEMPRSWISTIEAGRKEPTIDSVVKLAKGLKVPARTLVAISESRKRAA